MNSDKEIKEAVEALETASTKIRLILKTQYRSEVWTMINQMGFTLDLYRYALAGLTTVNPNPHGIVLGPKQQETKASTNWLSNPYEEEDEFDNIT